MASLEVFQFQYIIDKLNSNDRTSILKMERRENLSDIKKIKTFSLIELFWIKRQQRFVIFDPEY